MLVDLIEQTAAWSRAGLTILGADGSEEGPCLVVMEVPLLPGTSCGNDTLPKSRRKLAHGYGISKKDHRLVLLGGCSVDFSSLFVVCREHIHAYAGSQGGLTGALSRLNVGHSIPSVALVVLPPEDASDDKSLPFERIKGDILVVTACQPKNVREEVDGPKGCVNVPGPFATGKVPKMAFAGVPDVRSYKNLA